MKKKKKNSRTFNGDHKNRPGTIAGQSNGNGLFLRHLLYCFSVLFCQHIRGPDYYHVPGARRERACRRWGQQESGKKFAQYILKACKLHVFAIEEILHGLCYKCQAPAAVCAHKQVWNKVQNLAAGQLVGLWIFYTLFDHCQHTYSYDESECLNKIHSHKLNYSIN